jgi:hypothetical protein
MTPEERIGQLFHDRFSGRLLILARPCTLIKEYPWAVVI